MRPVGRFFLLCTIDAAALDHLAVHRQRHLDHVEAHRHLVAFGGVVGEPAGAPEAICYVLDVADRAQAAAFVAADPYAPHYASVRIEAFTQRLPEPDSQEEP